jgi:hypothetical protein
MYDCPGRWSVSARTPSQQPVKSKTAEMWKRMISPSQERRQKGQTLCRWNIQIYFELRGSDEALGCSPCDSHCQQAEHEPLSICFAW